MLTPDQMEALREALEEDLQDEVSRQLRAWLGEVRRTFLDTLTAASDGPGMGTVAGWWASRVDGALMSAVEAALMKAFKRNSVDASPSEEATNLYIAKVRDRLVKGTHAGVTVYDGAFDSIREALALSQAEGWTRNQLAQRIAAELSWEKKGDYWRRELARVDSQMDAILDALGPPGNAAREAARLNDSRIIALREQRNVFIKHLDAERSVWETRAMLIARTESTGAANFGGYQALTMEGVAVKEWIATGDSRTRDTHRAADGKKTQIDKPFQIGDALLMYPGDPNGPPEETVNCRCTVVGAES